MPRCLRIFKKHFRAPQVKKRSRPSTVTCRGVRRQIFIIGQMQNPKGRRIRVQTISKLVLVNRLVDFRARTKYYLHSINVQCKIQISEKTTLKVMNSRAVNIGKKNLKITQITESYTYNVKIFPA